MEMTGFGNDIEVLAKRLGEPGVFTSVIGADGGFQPFLLSALRSQVEPLMVVVLPERRAAANFCRALNGLYGEENASVAFHYQGPDVSPYQQISQNRHLVRERLVGLSRICTGEGIRYVVTSPDSLRHGILSREDYDKACLHLKEEDEVGIEPLLKTLSQIGYARVPTAEDPGTFAVRGGIVDVFSPLYPRPIRLDFYGDWVETMRFVDPKSQRSQENLYEAVIPPVQEVIFSAENIERGMARISELAGDLCFPSQQLRPIFDDIRGGIFSGHVEDLVPAFYESAGFLWDYLPDDALWITSDPDAVFDAVQSGHRVLEEEYERAKEKGRLVFPPEAMVRLPDALEKSIRGCERLSFAPFIMGELDGADLQVRVHSNRDLVDAIQKDKGSAQPFQVVVERIQSWRESEQLVAITCGTRGGVERLAGILNSYGVKTKAWPGPIQMPALPSLREDDADVHLFLGSVGQGFRFPPLQLVVLDESELLGPRATRSRKDGAKATDANAFLSNLRELNVGDFVVHLDHGIARYDGLVKLQFQGAEGDFLHLIFRGDHKLYLPVHRLSRIQKFVGMDAGAPKLDKLGGTQWEKTREQVKRNLLEMAEELIALQAARETEAGFAYPPADTDFHTFEASFPYEETVDQQRAIDEVIEDMCRPQNMDRLVCGDVGYGKTEVAVRAAFKAVQAGKQVAFLVPTTILAEQHRLTLQRRFENYPIFVESLSRYKSPKEQKAALARLKEGRVDVIVGTHRLLQPDVSFGDLGLVIIDEEHRFGVKDKEKLKGLKSQVDVLTLTATPIPRTLHLAMLGVRELSIIATPPEDRLAVRTVVARETDDFLVEAMERELKRGGQVFYVYNRVQSIEQKAEEISKLVPDARIGVAHGQMASGGLEKVMRAFIEGETNVLVCTTIIESGLDIPRANTLIIDRADRFGLADLYQLRGRVGRSNVRGYAYFMIPDPARLTGDAALRIGVLQRCADLGGGFQLATHDLEIRGAGNLLGASQSGHIEAVGYELYVEMLQAAVAELRGQEKKVEIDPELQIPVSALIPEEYCPDTGTRLMFYKRFSSVSTEEEVAEIHGDIVDRCGSAPDEVNHLVQLARLKVLAKDLGVTKLEFAVKGLALTLYDDSMLPVESLLTFLNLPDNRWRMRVNGDGMFRPVTGEQWEEGIDFVETALRELHTHVLGEKG